MTIDPKYLVDINFNDSVASIPKEKDAEGKKKIVYEKISRRLLSTDVLSFVERGNEVIFVTADGKKYQRPKIEKVGG